MEDGGRIGSRGVRSDRIGGLVGLFSDVVRAESRSPSWCQFLPGEGVVGVTVGTTGAIQSRGNGVHGTFSVRSGLRGSTLCPALVTQFTVLSLLSAVPLLFLLGGIRTSAGMALLKSIACNHPVTTTTTATTLRLSDPAPATGDSTVRAPQKPSASVPVIRSSGGCARASMGAHHPIRFRPLLSPAMVA